MGIAESARRLDAGLSPTSRRILDLLLADPQQMSKQSAASVAARLGVHETTVIRLAAQLGFPGYRSFRASLADEGLPRTTSAERMLSRDDGDYALASVVDDEMAALARLARSVAQSEVDELAHRILAARIVYLFGPPYAQNALALLARRLRRLGIVPIELPTSGRLIAEHLTSLTADDLVLSFVFRRPDPRLGRLLALAASTGAATVVVADEEGLAFEPAPDQVIVAPRGPRSTQRSLVVPTVFAYAVQAALFHHARERTAAALERGDEIARWVGDDEPSHGE